MHGAMHALAVLNALMQAEAEACDALALSPAAVPPPLLRAFSEAIRKPSSEAPKRYCSGLKRLLEFCGAGIAQVGCWPMCCVPVHAHAHVPMRPPEEHDQPGRLRGGQGWPWVSSSVSR